MNPAGESEMALLACLLDAIGGRARIAAITTYFREAIRTIRDATGAIEIEERVQTYRAAGGRIRIEAQPFLNGVEGCEVRPARVLCIPGTSVGLGFLPSPDDTTETVLREARLEPRNLLAHLHERPHLIRRAPGGSIEIDLPDEPISYRFHATTSLCEIRNDLRTGILTRFLDWRPVDGIATPFLEIRSWPHAAVESGRTVEDRVVRVAYDLPFPADTFTRN